MLSRIPDFYRCLGMAPNTLQPSIGDNASSTARNRSKATALFNATGAPQP